ncbi:hypothetical protein MRX96_024711 [Rhipicephalus microplus]
MDCQNRRWLVFRLRPVCTSLLGTRCLGVWHHVVSAGTTAVSRSPEELPSEAHHDCPDPGGSRWSRVAVHRGQPTKAALRGILQELRWRS